MMILRARTVIEASLKVKWRIHNITLQFCEITALASMKIAASDHDVWLETIAELTASKLQGNY